MHMVWVGDTEAVYQHSRVRSRPHPQSLFSKDTSVQLLSKMASDVDSCITFLSRHELYQTEKPYCTDFLVETPTARMTNHYFDVRPVKVYDARKNEKSFSLDRNGFFFVKAKTDLQAQDATSERTLLMEAYTQQIARIVQANIAEYTKVRVMDFQVSGSLELEYGCYMFIIP